MQILPAPSETEYAALKADIAKRGIQVPIEVDEKGDILDGNSRVRAWEELRTEGVKLPDYPRIVRSGMSDAEKRNHARSLNIIRRHLTKEQMEPIWTEMRADGMTYEAIAEASGVERHTVMKQFGKNYQTQPKKVVGKDGKHYPPKKKRKRASIFANDERQQKRAIAAVGKIDDSPEKVLDLKRAERIAREQENERLREDNASLPPIKTSGGIEIRIGEFPDILNDIKDDSADLILTDPPYSKEFLAQWEHLFTFATRTLKQGGFLITYCGQSILEEVMKRNGNLEYVWALAQLSNSAKKNINHHRHIYSQWKPILIFCKPSFQAINWVNDIVAVGKMEKELHDWQQSEQEAEYIISAFSKVESLIIDPFLGSGTVALASHHLGRAFIGCDIDAACVRKTLERLDVTN